MHSRTALDEYKLEYKSQQHEHAGRTKFETPPGTLNCMTPSRTSTLSTDVTPPVLKKGAF